MEARRRGAFVWAATIGLGGLVLYALADDVVEWLVWWALAAAAFTAVTLLTRLADRVLR